MRRKIVSILLALTTLFSLFTLAGCDTGIIDLFMGDKENTDTKIEKDDLDYTQPPDTLLLEKCHDGMILLYQSIYQETGLNPIISMDESRYYEETVSINGTEITRKVYTDVTVHYWAVGFRNYHIISQEEFEAIQEYQNKTGIQVIYPTVKYSDRPKQERNKYNANIYYQLKNPSSMVVRPAFDSSTGEFVPIYWTYEENNKPTLAPEYDSLRIEGEDGTRKDGKTYYYAYGRYVDGGIEVRLFLYEYYQYMISTGFNTPSIEEFFIRPITLQISNVF